MWADTAEVGRRLRAARLRSGMTMVVAAGRVGMSQPVLHRFETGKSALPYAALSALAGLYGMSPAELLGDVLVDSYKEYLASRMMAAKDERIKALTARLKAVTEGNCYDPACILAGNHTGTHYDGMRRYYAAPVDEGDDA